MALSKEQQEQLAELERLRDAPDDDGPDDDDAGPDDGHVIVLRGSRADSFLASLLGPEKPKATKAAPAGAPRPRKTAAPGKRTAADDAADDTGDDDGEPEPPKQNRYFR